MVSEIRLRIAKQQIDTPEPILASRPVSQLSTVNAPFACITLDLSDLPTLPSNQKALMEGYLRRGGFLWAVAHAPTPDYDPSKVVNSELFTEEILKRVLPASLITPENVKPTGFPQVIPPSVIDPTLSTELTSLISHRLRTLEILSIEGRPAAVVTLTFPTPEIKDIYERHRPPINPSAQKQPSNPSAKKPINPNENKSFSINHLAVNLYANILLH